MLTLHVLRGRSWVLWGKGELCQGEKRTVTLHCSLHLRACGQSKQGVPCLTAQEELGKLRGCSGSYAPMEEDVRIKQSKALYDILK